MRVRNAKPSLRTSICILHFHLKASTSPFTPPFQGKRKRGRRYPRTPNHMEPRRCGGHTNLEEALPVVGALQDEQGRRVGQWKDRVAWNIGPIPPEGPRKEVCHYFQGSLWVPDISTRWQVLSVWDLVYNEERNGDITRFNIRKQRTEAKRKWIHLPIARRDLVLDLTKRIYVASGRDLRAYQKVEKLVSDMFRQVDVTGPKGKVHFKFKSLKHDHQADPGVNHQTDPGVDHQADLGDKECISNSIYAIVVHLLSHIYLYVHSY
ncbi:hypothetical protein QBC32DRAFT_104422 [Pseudoneurospora amorphoporcata]|uniref:Uncharacterized protein n=1 Tax=Pseudoneurospora amorphoporcata TaxID=241081 RepID=A0AAN6NK56_9PEZI|nr:hypothetical protein QBC32DRAFT_104422 [Pseudoneurospora amorphoporcata]